MEGKVMDVVAGRDPEGSWIATRASTCGLPVLIWVKVALPEKSCLTLLLYEIPKERSSVAFARTPMSQPKLVAVSLWRVTSAASVTICVKGFTMATLRSRVKEVKRMSRPTPTLRRSASLYPTVGFTEKPLSSACLERKRPVKVSGLVQPDLRPKGVFQPTPTTNRSLIWWLT